MASFCIPKSFYLLFMASFWISKSFYILFKIVPKMHQFLDRYFLKLLKFPWFLWLWLFSGAFKIRSILGPLWVPTWFPFGFQNPSISFSWLPFGSQNPSISFLKSFPRCINFLIVVLLCFWLLHRFLFLTIASIFDPCFIIFLITASKAIQLLHDKTAIPFKGKVKRAC